ncbi:hypothetical protein TNCV_2418671 [Trichonephila clavipes]|nr:hypothetical protein TNCV_2418671 [Trichonephila clavipes]
MEAGLHVDTVLALIEDKVLTLAYYRSWENKVEPDNWCHRSYYFYLRLLLRFYESRSRKGGGNLVFHHRTEKPWTCFDSAKQRKNPGKGMGQLSTGPRLRPGGGSSHFRLNLMMRSLIVDFGYSNPGSIFVNRIMVNVK